MEVSKTAKKKQVQAKAANEDLPHFTIFGVVPAMLEKCPRFHENQINDQAGYNFLYMKSRGGWKINMFYFFMLVF